MEELLKRFAFLNNKQIEQMSQFAEILLEENKKYNPCNVSNFNNARMIEIGYVIYSSAGVKITEKNFLIKPINFYINTRIFNNIFDLSFNNI